jgi:hypothetical protein
MDVDGVFIDNVHPSATCLGVQQGHHQHLYPDQDNIYSFRLLLGSVPEIGENHFGNGDICRGMVKEAVAHGATIALQAKLQQGGKPHVRLADRMSDERRGRVGTRPTAGRGPGGGVWRAADVPYALLWKRLNGAVWGGFLCNETLFSFHKENPETEPLCCYV